MATVKTIRQSRQAEPPVTLPERLGHRGRAGPRASPREVAEQDRRLTQLGQTLLEVAHQLRGPLGAIHLYAGLLAQQLGKEAPPQALVRKILTGVVSLSALLEDLFLFAETETLRREPCYLLDALERALGFAEPYLEERDVRLTRLYGGELDAVDADARLLSSVFLNVVLNAVEAMPTGGELVVALRRARGPAQVQEVRFEDTGTGFSDPALAHLFEPFYSDKPSGAGLGLAVARRIIRAHGGQIEAANGPRGGALITIHLPICGAPLSVGATVESR